jgi:hypothetical protein
MVVIFGFSILENIKFTKNIPCSWKKKYFCRPVLLEKLNDEWHVMHNSRKGKAIPVTGRGGP